MLSVLKLLRVPPSPFKTFYLFIPIYIEQKKRGRLTSFFLIYIMFVKLPKIAKNKIKCLLHLTKIK